MNKLITEISITSARTEDVDAVADVLGAAFVDDPVFTWCIPDRDRRTVVLPAFFGLVTRALLAHDHVQIAGSHQAVALWVPPATAPNGDDSAEFEHALDGVLGDAGERAFELMSLLEAVHLGDPHWYLWFLATAPADQGTGLGSGLLRHMLARCDRDGVPAYLEATSVANRRLYERHGFVVVDEVTVSGGPTLWAMWRPGAQVRQVVGASGR